MTLQTKKKTFTKDLTKASFNWNLLTEKNTLRVLNFTFHLNKNSVISERLAFWLKNLFRKYILKIMFRKYML